MCVDLVSGKTSVYGIIGNPVKNHFHPSFRIPSAERWALIWFMCPSR